MLEALTRDNGMGILSCRQYCRTFRRRLIKDTLRQSILIKQLEKSLDIYIWPLRQHFLHKLTFRKLAIINVSICPWDEWHLFTLRRKRLTHHHGLISSEFQTGNSSIILQKWQCEVWSYLDTHHNSVLSDSVIDMLWFIYKKEIKQQNYRPIDYLPRNCPTIVLEFRLR